VLLLWDRVVGFDSLLPLPVLAVAVFSFRGDALRCARSGAEVLEVMEHLSQLQVGRWCGSGEGSSPTCSSGAEVMEHLSQLQVGRWCGSGEESSPTCSAPTDVSSRLLQVVPLLQHVLFTAPGA
jgi:hypothetical protein